MLRVIVEHGARRLVALDGEGVALWRAERALRALKEQFRRRSPLHNSETDYGWDHRSHQC
jgi:hypothetical protein